VPIVPDESRTFGMEGLFRQSASGARKARTTCRKTRPADVLQGIKTGQILQEGINEAGAMSDWIAAATSYSVHNVQTMPFYICYSMFGLQRVGDLAWAAGDQRARGFLLGGTAGRTTLNGEGLQHEDGHSHPGQPDPNCVSYDPTFQYEVAVIIQDGMRRMVQEQEDVFYYITVMNENYEHPEMPVGAEADIIKGMYAFKKGAESEARASSCWAPAPSSAKSSPPPTAEERLGRRGRPLGLPELQRTGPRRPGRRPLEPAASAGSASSRRAEAGRCQGPVIASTDYIKLFAEQIRPFVKGRTSRWAPTVSAAPTPAKLRHHFEVDRHWVTLAALKALADEGKIDARRWPPPWSSTTLTRTSRTR
jgi:pyruvate dehydrogenase E1 component